MLSVPTNIALGSLAEVSYLLRFSRDYGLLGPEAWLRLEDLRSQAGRLTWSLYFAISQDTELQQHR